MEKFEYQGVDLAEVLPRLPEGEVKGLPFGVVKLDSHGRILEYNMAEGEIAGVDPAWAKGRNFFDEVAVCTKTPAFYGRFVEGVDKGFLNTVFDYTFDHRAADVKIRVHMFMSVDYRGRRVVYLIVKRVGAAPVVPAARPLQADATGATGADLRPAPPLAAANPPPTKPSPKPSTSTGHVDLLDL
jgi:photoactive yellow protein